MSQKIYHYAIKDGIYKESETDTNQKQENIYNQMMYM